MTLGTTDELCYNISERPVHVHDLNATIMQLLGIGTRNSRFVFRGRIFRLTDVSGDPIREILT